MSIWWVRGKMVSVGLVSILKTGKIWFRKNLKTVLYMFGEILSFDFEMSPRPRMGTAQNFLAEIFFFWVGRSVGGFDRLKMTQRPLARGLEGGRG